jgi:hypothetical protein
LALAVALARRTVARALSVGATALAVTTFVRPELAAPFLAAWVATAVACLVARDASSRLERSRLVATPALAFFALVLFFGNPLSQARSFEAFVQHYALQVTGERERYERSENPWYLYPSIIQRDFGDARSVTEAARANPRAFLWHVGRNVSAMPSAFVAMLRPSLPIGPRAQVAVAVALAVVLVGGVLLGIARLARARARGRLDDLRIGVTLVTIAGCTIVPVIAIASLVFPRSRYLVAIIAPVGVLAAWGLSWPLGWTRCARATWAAPLLAASTVALMPARSIAELRADRPDPAALAPWYARLGGWVTVPRTRPLKVTVAELLLRLPDPTGRPIRILESGRFHLYAKPEAVLIDPGDCMPFVACVASKQPDIVVFGPDLLETYDVAADTGARDFLAMPPPPYRLIEVAHFVIAFRSRER